MGATDMCNAEAFARAAEHARMEKAGSPGATGNGDSAGQQGEVDVTNRNIAAIAPQLLLDF